MIELNDISLGWVAGIIEGEGCIGITSRANRPPTSKRVFVEVSMCDKDTIDKLHELVPGFSHNYIRQTKTGKNVYRWRLTSHSKIKALCEVITPLMSERRKGKISEVLEYINRNAT